PMIAKPNLISRLEEEEGPFLPGCDEEAGLAGVVWQSASEAEGHRLMEEEDTCSSVKEKFEFWDAPRREEGKHPPKGRNNAGVLQGDDSLRENTCQGDNMNEHTILT
ncbi:UNVERIFIED_CONTAM: hypothetical protein K2H54_066536, partial [Gekko kuhli]